MTVRRADNRGKTPAARRAISLVEAVVSIAIVGLMLAAVLNTVGAAVVTREHASEQARAVLLADDLLAEILQQAYEEPIDAANFGRESGETSSSRAAYDDVDDYDDWSASPPQLKDGTAIAELDGWTRRVKIDYVTSSNLLTSTASDTGVKRITVTVSGSHIADVTLVAVRTGSGTAKVK